MELRRPAEGGPEQFKAVRRGWFLGDKKFHQELLAQMKEPVGEHNYGEERAETEQEHAERIVREGLKRLGLEGGRLGGASQRRSGKTEAGRPLARGNDGDREMDSRPFADGRLDAPQPPAILAPT